MGFPLFICFAKKMKKRFLNNIQMKKSDIYSLIHSSNYRLQSEPEKGYRYIYKIHGLNIIDQFIVEDDPVITNEVES